MNEADAFERAIVENPDDLATYSAYADWLQERDDPRGEFMSVQLALEDEARAGAARAALKAREAELLALHEREWLGELAPHLLDHVDALGHPRPAAEHWWARGFVSEMRVEYFTAPLAAAVARAPAARFLRKLHVEGSRPELRTPAPRPDQPDLLAYLDMPDEVDDPAPELDPPAPHLTREQEPYFGLIGAPCLRSLRVFQFGPDVEPEPDGSTEPVPEARGLELLVADMPRVEELYLLCDRYDAAALFALPNLTNLQVLRVYGLGEQGFAGPVPLRALARNPALAALTHLLVHPRSAAAPMLPVEQVRELVDSPHLKSLSHLQLRRSTCGDEGVAALVASGALKRLGWLDLRNGTITDAGARLLAACAAARNLRRLDLSRNAVTSIGLGVLRRMGVNAVASTELSRREQAARDAAVRNARGGSYDPTESTDGDME